MTPRALRDTQLDLLLLAVLDRAPAHGYAVTAALRELSGGAFDPADGTLYPALHRLERDGAVTSRVESVGRRRRRVYELTDSGHAVLAEGRRDWRAHVRAIAAVLGTTA